MRRGINLGNALEAPREGQWGVIIEDYYFQVIKEAGFDTVRIPIKWSAHASNEPPFVIEEGFFDRVDHVVEQALEQGLLVVINIHHYDELVQDPEGQRERFLALWGQIAEHYASYPPELYFEILNEPNGPLDRYWNDYLLQAIEVIRKTNPQRMLIAGPGNWNSVGELRNLSLPETDRNIYATFHYYNPFGFTHQGAEWVENPPPTGIKWEGYDHQKRTITEQLDQAAEWAQEHDRRLFMGEFGAYSKADMESRVRWTSFVARAAEERDIAWAYWEFCAGFGAYDPELRRWREPLLRALIPE